MGDWVPVRSRRRAEEQLAIDIPDSNVAAEFVSAIKGGTPNLASAQEGAQAVALTEATYRSAAEGRIIEIEDEYASDSLKHSHRGNKHLKRVQL